MHLCVSRLTIIGSDNGMSPEWRQVMIWTNAGILLIWPLGTNFSEILTEIHTFSFKKMHLENGGHFVQASIKHSLMSTCWFLCYWLVYLGLVYWHIYTSLGLNELKYLRSPADWLFVQQHVETNIRENIKALLCWSFMWWISFPCHNIFTIYYAIFITLFLVRSLIYHQVSNIRRSKSQHLKDSRTVLRLSLPNPLKPDVKLRMKM